MRLSVLDQSPIKSGSTPSEAVQETLELAQLAERLGEHRYYTGRMGPYPSVEEAEADPCNPHEEAIARHVRGRSVVGTPERVRERLIALAGEYAADELVVVTITHDPKARLHSYELLAGAFELERREEPTP